jgi:hypothetical protein
MKQKKTSIYVQVMTREDRLQFAVRFAQMNLDTLRAGDRLNLREDFLGFLNLRPNHGHSNGGVVALQTEGSTRELYQPLMSLGFVGVVEGPTPDTLSEDDFLALQRDVQRDVWTVLDTLTHAVRPGETSNPPFVGRCPEVRVMQNGWYAKGTSRQVFVEQLLYLLGQEPSDRILRCPECETLFYRVQKQAYCSRRCGNRVTQRRWRERQEASSPATE